MLPLYDLHRTRVFPYATLLIIAINVLVFFLEIFTPDINVILEAYALIPAKVDFSQITTLYTFFTSAFLHGGFMHIISNMLFLWVFGDNVEEHFGVWFIPFYLLGAFAAGLLQYVIDPTSVIPTIGASGAVAAVLGAYFAMYPHHKIRTLVPLFGFATIVNLPSVVMLLYWFIVQLFNGLASLGLPTEDGGVAWFAHIGGFVFGWLIATPFRDTRDVKYRR